MFCCSMFAVRRYVYISLNAHVTDTLSVANGRRFFCRLADEFVEAVEMYREVLRSSEEHKGRLKTDSLQVRNLIPHSRACD